jgi:hypothetical protein
MSRVLCVQNAFKIVRGAFLIDLATQMMGLLNDNMMICQGCKNSNAGKSL